MPTLHQQDELQATGGLRFLGVNLRQSRSSLADDECAKAINADFHTQYGALVLRLGKTALYSSALADAVVRQLGRISPTRYQIAGRSIYRDSVRIATNVLSANLVTTLIPYRPLNDTKTSMFIADDTIMKRDDGTTLFQWGITAPTATPVVAIGAAGSLTGDYSVRFTYIRKVAGALVAESNPTAASNTVTLAAKVLSVSVLTASTDAQVTHVRLYRTASGGSVYLFDQDIATGTTASSTQADTALGTAIDLTGNAVPPVASYGFAFNDTLFLCRDTLNPHYLWFSKRFQPESFPPANFVEITNPSDPIQAGISNMGLAGVFTRLTKFRVFGNATSGYIAQEAISKRGTPAPMAVNGSEFGVLFVARDGVWVTNFVSPDTSIGDQISPLFIGQTVNDMDPINWAQANQMTASTFKRRYYLSYASGINTLPDTMAVYSHDTRHWYFYDHPLSSLFYEEDTDQFLGGGQDGNTYILESGTTDNGAAIALVVETKDFTGSEPLMQGVRKLFLYTKLDLNTQGDAVTIVLIVDDTVRGSQTVTTTGRTVRLLSFPAGAQGYRWRMRISYTGRKAVAIYGLSALYLPMGLA